MPKRVEKPDAEWRRLLDADVYRIARRKGTEPPFTGRYWNYKEEGTYVCACCGTPLFDSSSKYDSGTGWPSFGQPVHEDHVAIEQDQSHGLDRVEVLCAVCDAHLGHVFEDGPEPTGLRYCTNSAALRFEPEAAPESADDVGEASPEPAS